MTWTFSLWKINETKLTLENYEFLSEEALKNLDEELETLADIRREGSLVIGTDTSIIKLLCRLTEYYNVILQ